MENTEADPVTEIDVGGRPHRAIDLRALCGTRFERLPVVIRGLLENVARNMTGAERAAAIAALLDWVATGTSEAEIAFQPGRVLMHDTTSTPALVDIAAMRSTLAEAGIDPTLLEPELAGRRVGRSLAGGRGLRAARRTAAEHGARDAPQRRALHASCAGRRRCCAACGSIRRGPGSCTRSTWSSSRRSSRPKCAMASSGWCPT